LAHCSWLMAHSTKTDQTDQIDEMDQKNSSLFTVHRLLFMRTTKTIVIFHE
jgi:hypothetical protein